MSGSTSPGSTTKPSPFKPRIHVLCFDGTASQFGGENTNVVKFFAMLRKDCDNEQLCYYQTGIGTYEAPGMMTPIIMKIYEAMDEAVAWYLDAHVMGGYKFLMNNYRCGDKIALFGFSRGAYTARALAGMLAKVGLLPRDNVEQVTFAYQLYTRTDAPGLIEAAGFKETFCRSVEIEFLGVWDTVASTGIIKSRNLPFTTNNSLIKTFRHALSLDEHRAKFVPTFWQFAKSTPLAPEPGTGATPPAVKSAIRKARESSSPLSAGTRASDTAVLNLTRNNNGSKEKPDKKAWSMFSKRGSSDIISAVEIDPEESPLNTSDVKEVWFCGCHSDVGGGADKNSVTNSLSDIPLRWMVREVVASKCGIQFDAAVMERLNVNVSLSVPGFFMPATSALNDADPSPQPSPEDTTDDTLDAVKPLHDELRLQPLWWPFEVVPLPFSWQDASGAWRTRWELHLGRGRYVNRMGPLLFHETVRVRMADSKLHYKPRAKYTKGKETYVW